MTRLRQISLFSITKAQQMNILTIYGDFPVNSEFKHPNHIPPDVKWAVISIKGKERIAGYLEDNVFHIVFLDKDHKF